MKLCKSLFRRYTLVSQLHMPTVRRPFVDGEPDDRAVLASKSHQLMYELGLIDYVGRGCRGLYHLLPIATRVLNKLINLIDDEMQSIGAHRVTMSSLCPKAMMEQSGRFDIMQRDLFKFTDRFATDFCLAPTHEEQITKLLADNPDTMGVGKFPLLLYQITNKYRDEHTPRFGLLRSREFLMKDLYAFDVDEIQTQQTYDLVNDAYVKIFRRLNLPFCRVLATSGAMGGDLSHEFHVENPCGQDEILYCRNCATGLNVDVARERGLLKKDDVRLDHDQCGRPFDLLRTIEVGHTFVLGTKYTKAFDVTYETKETDEGKKKGFVLAKKFVHMSCYGIGVSRLMAACLDCLSRNMEMRWPAAIAPFKIWLIPPKKGSKEGDVHQLAVDIVEGLSNLPNCQHGDVVFDDRTTKTVGHRLRDALKLGCSYIVVVNKAALGYPIPKFELWDVNSNSQTNVTHAELFEKLSQI